jgi:ATP-binding cassette subfamily C (CFTR/MRP) protein 1
VKWDVYFSYAEAASKIAFALFCASFTGQPPAHADVPPTVFMTVAQQALNLASNLTLRNWGEHNQGQGHSRDAFHYLALYGVRALAVSYCLWTLTDVRV